MLCVDINVTNIVSTIIPSVPLIIANFKKKGDFHPIRSVGMGNDFMLSFGLIYF